MKHCEIDTLELIIDSYVDSGRLSHCMVDYEIGGGMCGSVSHDMTQFLRQRGCRAQTRCYGLTGDAIHCIVKASKYIIDPTIVQFEQDKSPYVIYNSEKEFFEWLKEVDIPAKFNAEMTKVSLEEWKRDTREK